MRRVLTDMQYRKTARNRTRIGGPARRVPGGLALLCLLLGTAALAQDPAPLDPDPPPASSQAENVQDSPPPASAEATQQPDPASLSGASADPENRVPELEPLPPLPLPPSIPVWPTVEQLAAALADPARRRDTQLTVAAFMSLQRQSRISTNEADASLRARELLANREWLFELEKRYGFTEARSPVLDPAAWQVQVQLDRIGLPNTRLASPLGPGRGPLAAQVLDREAPALAAAALPELLWYLEGDAPLVWASLVRRLEEDPWLAASLAAQGGALFDWPSRLPAGTAQDGPADGPTAGESVRQATAQPQAESEPEGDAASGPEERLLTDAMLSLSVTLDLAINDGPPDLERLRQLRYELLRRMPDFNAGQRAQANLLLHLATLLDGLARENYFYFAESLLAITAQLQNDAAWYPERFQQFSSWLAGAFPPVSAAYGRAFSVVDPQLNTAVATAYDVVQALARETTPEQRADLRLRIGDAVAQLSLLIPDLGFYFDQPIRDPIAGGVDACTGKAGQLEADGSPSMSRDLFDDCQNTLVDLATTQAREAQLAGNANGPFGPAQLRREFGLTASQRINYALGYLHERYDVGCTLPARPLPNPLEWSYLATFMAWFAEQSPVYFQTPENEARLRRMRSVGEEMITVLRDEVDCFAGAGAGINDPVERIMTDYLTELRELARGLDSARESFRTAILAPGADVRLEGSATQSTAYRPAEMTIGPCDPRQVCEMTGALSSTRALSGLFEDVFLVADQAGLGELEICYDNVGWVDRRLEPVRPGDGNVANYFGRLAFDLRGRFVQGDDAADLFAFRFTAPEPSHYLFSAASEEVLNDACPTEWVGTRIVTGLPEGSFRIVPDRLTYLSAARTVPSRLLESNWDQGAEWRDWFVTGLGVERLPLPPAPDINAPLNQRLEALYRQERATLYGVLSAGEQGPNLSAELDDLTISKLLLRTQMMLFFPHILNHSDSLREAITGQQGLLDQRLVLRARQQELPIDELLSTGIERAEAFRAEWRRVPEAVRRQGSVADSVAHGLLRLEAIYDTFFASPVEAPSATAPGLTGPLSAGVESASLAGAYDQAGEIQAAEDQLQ